MSLVSNLEEDKQTIEAFFRNVSEATAAET